jgi:hypothetical protein
MIGFSLILHFNAYFINNTKSTTLKNVLLITLTRLTESTSIYWNVLLYIFFKYNVIDLFKKM